MFTKILVPLDGSDGAEKALEIAAEIAGRFNSQVVLLEVTPGYGPALAATAAEPFGSSGSVAAAVAMEEGAEVAATAYLDAVNQQYGGKWQTVVAEGSSAETIVAQCERLGADLIVMATHARSGFARLFLGSVVDDVIRSAKGVPVLVVHLEHSE